jgi:hypothetical protein
MTANSMDDGVARVDPAGGPGGDGGPAAVQALCPNCRSTFTFAPDEAAARSAGAGGPRVYRPRCPRCGREVEVEVPGPGQSRQSEVPGDRR